MRSFLLVLGRAPRDPVRTRPASGGERVIVVVLAGMTTLGVLASPSLAYPRPGRTERVSVASDGAEGNADSFSTLIGSSQDDRFVSFHSAASNLVPGDTNEATDVFVHDRDTGITERASVASDGTEGNGNSQGPSVSADGRYIAFWGPASNLVPGDTNGAFDVFVRDRVSGTTDLASISTDGTQGNARSMDPSISADGRYVAFSSQASTLVSGDTNGLSDVFVRDRMAGTTELASVAPSGTTGDSFSISPSMSADGRHVAFWSYAANLVPGDTNGNNDVFVRDRTSETTLRIPVGDNDTSPLAMSADGRHVAFRSYTSSLVPGDTNSFSDIFVHELETGATERVSVGAAGTEANDDSRDPSVSADGRYVAFLSYASNLVPGDTNEAGDVLVRDRETGVTERVSMGDDGTEAGASAQSPHVSAHGRYVAFRSQAPNLVAEDTNGAWDVFVRDRGPDVGVGRLSAIPAEDRVSVSGWATFSGAVVASTADPPGDGLLQGQHVGADITAVRLIYRPEQEDLLVRLPLASIPSADDRRGYAGGGYPAVLYGLDLTAGGADYQVRGFRAAASRLPPAAPHFALYRCELVCTEAAQLLGGIGTTAMEVVISVPLAALGAAEGATLSGLRAFTAIGEAAPEALVVLDEAHIPDAKLPIRLVSLAIVPAGTPQQEIDHDGQAVLTAGSFSGILDVTSLPVGDYDVWARACLGDACGAASTLVLLR